jgi:hypothetical protein
MGSGVPDAPLVASVTLIEILLPLNDKSGRPQPKEAFADLRRLLVERFGGLTAFSRSPADGLWVEGDQTVERDKIIVFQVMADYLDRTWWSALRKRLEDQLGQEKIVIRASTIETL